MPATSTIDDSNRAARRTNPLRSAPAAVVARRAVAGAPRSVEPASPDPPVSAAVARRSAQLPAFAPLLEDLEVAGWSSHRRLLSGNFHDWLMLEGLLLVAVGQAVGAESADPAEEALVAQSAWAAIRAHAHHVRDAGTLLSYAGRSLWPAPDGAVQAAVAVAMLDTAEGHATVAMAGDCLAWKIRAATSEQLTVRQPMLGEAADFTYVSQSVQLSLRERLLLVADNPLLRSPKLPSSVAASFAHLDAESHRRMIAADALALLRGHYEQGPAELRSPASIVAVRRR